MIFALLQKLLPCGKNASLERRISNLELKMDDITKQFNELKEINAKQGETLTAIGTTIGNISEDVKTLHRLAEQVQNSGNQLTGENQDALKTISEGAKATSAKLDTILATLTALDETTPASTTTTEDTGTGTGTGSEPPAEPV